MHAAKITIKRISIKLMEVRIYRWREINRTLKLINSSNFAYDRLERIVTAFLFFFFFPSYIVKLYSYRYLSLNFVNRNPVNNDRSKTFLPFSFYSNRDTQKEVKLRYNAKTRFCINDILTLFAEIVSL